MASANVTSNHPLVCDVFPNLPSQLGFSLQIFEGIEVADFLLASSLVKFRLEFLGRNGGWWRYMVGHSKRISWKRGSGCW